MRMIIPSLWFDDNAEEAVNFYLAVFPDSKIGTTMRYGKASSEVAKRKLAVLKKAYEK